MLETVVRFGKFVVRLEMIKPELQIQAVFKEIQNVPQRSVVSYSTVVFLILRCFQQCLSTQINFLLNA